MIIELPQSHAFPLLRAGGAFLIPVGTAIAVGAWLNRWRWLALFAGALVGSVAAIRFAVLDVADLGAPTRFQLASLAIAVALELTAITRVNSRLRSRGNRTILLGTLLVVSVHFAIMLPAFGPLMGVLAVLGTLNALAGLSWLPNTAWQVFWLVDGLLKTAIGSVMVAIAA